MSRQILLRSPAVNRKQPLLEDKKFTGGEKKKGRCGEVAGGTAAECAAICCCCPCAVLNLVITAVYKVPAGLCKKIQKKRRVSKKKKKGLLQQENAGGSSTRSREILTVTDGVENGEEEKGAESVDLENDLWAPFPGTGFWRSTSQREDKDI